MGVLKMLPNELLKSITCEFEKLMCDPQVVLDSLNIEIAYTNSMIAVLSGRLESLENRRDAHIRKMLKDVDRSDPE
jgi:hypothetical protein